MDGLVKKVRRLEFKFETLTDPVETVRGPAQQQVHAPASGLHDIGVVQRTHQGDKPALVIVGQGPDEAAIGILVRQEHVAQ